MSATPPMSSAPPDRVEGARLLALAWYRRARTAQVAHARAATRSRALFLWLGVPAVVLGGFAGSALAADAFRDQRFVIALASLLAALLTALQTFLRLDDRRIAHESAARRFGTIRRELGALGALGLEGPTVGERLEEIRTDYDEASSGSPQVPHRIWSAQKARDRDYVPDEFAAWPRVTGASSTTGAGGAGGATGTTAAGGTTGASGAGSTTGSGRASGAGGAGP